MNNNYETLITKIDERITRLAIAKDILRTVPNVDAKTIIKKLLHIDIEKLEKELDDQ